jgi:hypothetical protein
MKKIILLGIALVFALTFSAFAQEANTGAETTNAYGELSPEEQVQYLKDNYGINVETAGLGAVSISGEIVTITNGDFKYEGATFKGGKVIISNDQITLAESTEIYGYTHQGAKISGTVSIKSGELLIEKGNIEINKETDPSLAITAQENTAVKVTGEYTGEIKAGNKKRFEVVLWPNHEGIPQQINVRNQIQLVNGRVISGKNLEAFEPVDILLGAPGEKVSFGRGTDILNGNLIYSENVCVENSCTYSKYHFTVKLIPQEGGKAKFEYRGTNIKYGEIENSQNEYGENIQTVVTKREIVDTESSIYHPETKSWTLSMDTKIRELRPFGELATIKVRKDTEYFPEADSRSVCDSIEGSCLAIDKRNSVRVKVNDDNHISIKTSQTLPSLVVDKIDGKGSVYYGEFDNNKFGNNIDVDILFKKGEADIFPPSGIKLLKTQAIYDYDTASGEERAIRISPLGKQVSINGESIAFFDEEVVQNYYFTRFGSAINKVYLENYQKNLEYIQKRFPRLDVTDPEMADLLMTALSSGENAFAAGVVGDTYQRYLKYLPEAIDKNYFVRELIGNVRGTDGIRTFTNIAEQLDYAIKTSPILNAQIMNLYEEGYMYRPAVSLLSEQFNFMNIDNPEEASKYLNIFKEVDTKNYQEVKKVMGKALDIASLEKLGIIKTDLSTIDILEKVLRNEKLENIQLPEEIQMSNDEFFQIMGDFREMDGIAGGRSYNINVETKYEIIKNSPELARKWSALAQIPIKSDNPWGPPAFKVHTKNKETREQTLELLNLFAVEKNNPQLSKETQKLMQKSFDKIIQNQLGPALNSLNHDNKMGEVASILKKIDNRIIVSILAQEPNGRVGMDNGIYRGNLILIEKEISKRAKKEGKTFMGYVESKVESEKQKKQTYRMLVATGIAQTHLAKESPEVIKQISEYIAKDIILEEGGVGYFMAASGDLVKDKKTNQIFQEQLLLEYERLSERIVDFNADGILDERDEEFSKQKKIVMEAFIIRNKEQFDQNNPQTAAIINNPNPKAIAALDGLKIPVGIYKKWPKTEDGTPVRLWVYSHGNTAHYKPERRFFEKFKNTIPGAKVTKEIKNEEGKIVAYEVEAPGKHKDANDGVIKVKDRFIVMAAEEYEDYGEEMDRYDEMAERGELFGKVYGGHVGHLGKVGTKETLRGESTVIFYNGCWGAGNVNEAIRSGLIGEDTFTIGTYGTGRGEVRAAYLTKLREQLGKTDDMVKAGEEIKKKVSKLKEGEKYTTPYETKISRLMTERGIPIEYRYEFDEDEALADNEEIEFEQI